MIALEVRLVKRRRIISVLTCILVFLGLLLIKVGEWIPQNFGDIPFEQILFHLIVPMEGTDTSFVESFIEYCLPIPAFVSGLLLFFCFLRDMIVSSDIKNDVFEHKKNNVLIIITTVACLFIYGFGITDCIRAVGIDEYWYNISHPSKIYENYYVDPSTVNYTFPEQKRNLVYIFLESMETTYEDLEHGGAFEESRIPELTELADNNLTFSFGNNDNNGFLVPSLSSWTVGGLVGQTSGIPLNIPVDGNSYVSDKSFLPGAYSIGDILATNGYQNELLLGSDATFGGRKYYFEQHGNFNIVDYNSAKKNGWIDENYKVWWGYEDLKLFEFAKIELSNLAATGQPFNFNMLTADTHHIGGYPCSECEDLYGDQYSNVIRCSSKHVTELVQWIQEQPWYENTTILLAGDHTSMDPDWFKDIEESGYNRKCYYAIINSAATPTTQNSRKITTYDLFPTTLASLGVTFNSDRLGLGTNLYTDTSTLVENLGFKKFDKELTRHSNYYDKYILYGKGKD